jgi:ABC-type sulfate transport system permease component
MLRIGQILSQSVPLSDHDVEEILQEQKTTRQPFGSAALALGKAQPEQVWAAWLTQVQSQPIDLSRLDSDAAAITALPAGLAMLYGLVPLRVRGDQLVVAAANDVPASAIAHVERRCGLHLIVARAAAPLVEQAMAKLYPASTTIV